MTAYFIVQTGCTAQTDPYSWSGTTILDVGTIKSERMSIETGLSTYTTPFKSSNETIGQNLTGEVAIIRLSGWKSGDASARETFRQNMKLIARYQQNIGVNSTFLYQNSGSDDNVINGSGMRVKLVSLSFDKEVGQGFGYVLYSVVLREVKDQ